MEIVGLLLDNLFTTLILIAWVASVVFYFIMWTRDLILGFVRPHSVVAGHRREHIILGMIYMVSLIIVIVWALVHKSATGEGIDHMISAHLIKEQLQWALIPSAVFHFKLAWHLKHELEGKKW